VNVRTARLLPFDLTPVVERSIYGMRVSVKGNEVFALRSPQVLSYLTQRRRLDAFLVEQASRAGAVFKEGCPVRAVERFPQSVTVRAGSAVFHGRVLVAADGANGPTGRLSGIDVRRAKEIALEGNVLPPASYPTDWQDMFGIDLGTVPGGYGWLFPKGDHLNIGVGGLASIGPTLRRRLDAMTRMYGYNPATLRSVRGHPLPVRLPGSRVADGNVLLAGDAAGLLDPLTGEGIYGAVWSGMAAAESIASYFGAGASSPVPYQVLIESVLEPELMTARTLHRLFHFSPGVWARLVRRSPRAWSAVCRLTTGELTYSAVRARSRLIDVGLDAGAVAAALTSYVGELGAPFHRKSPRGV
jgi:flavin-dependent dehydrogenase